MHYFLSGWLLLAFLSSAAAQPYTQGKTRYRFAQTYFGVDVQGSTDGSSGIVGPDGQLAATTLPTTLAPRLTIGGLHFWGHADFYVAFSLPWSVLPRRRAGTTLALRTGIETGGRYFPWRIETGKLRPFVGLAFASWSYRQYASGEGRAAPLLRQQVYPVQLGAVYGRGQHLLEAGVDFRRKMTVNYYIDREQTVALQTPRAFVWLGYKWYFDSSTSLEGKYEVIRQRDSALARRRLLDNWSWGIGPSAAFFTRSSGYNGARYPYLGEHFGAVFPELGLGYWWARPDVHANLAARFYGSTRRAYGLEQQIRRRALTLEAYKFLGDYHGFVPFAGPALSAEWWTVREQAPDVGERRGAWRGLRPGLVFGWDIRPFKRLNTTILRTNLRYFPSIRIEMPDSDGRSLRADQLEFNFIQLVFYPGKAKRVNRVLRRE